MKSSPILRVLMAAGLYLLLLWGYLALQTPQLFAAFEALVLSIALLFWVSEARERDMENGAASLPETASIDLILEADSFDPSVAASNKRLDALKSDLMDQYAQFGRDQSSLNRKGLGRWQQNRRQRGEGEA